MDNPHVLSTADFKSRDGGLRNLTKQYKPVFTRPCGRQRIASAGFVSTRPATILVPSYSHLSMILSSLTLI
jgi:hypothetical protein